MLNFGHSMSDIFVHNTGFVHLVLPPGPDVGNARADNKINMDLAFDITLG